MACQPYSPTPGLFFNTSPTWTNTPKGSWSFQCSGDIMQLKNGTDVVDSVSVPLGSTCNWLWFQATKFVALRSAVTSGGFVDYKLWIFDLRTAAAVTHYQVPEILMTDAGHGLTLNPAPDDSAFFIWLSTSTFNESKNHAVYRSDRPMMLCSAGPVTPMDPVQRLAEFIAGQVWIYVSPGPPLPPPHTGGGTIIGRCDLPSGNCDVQPDSQNFPEVVVGGPAALATTTRQFTIKNTGNDCLSIGPIANVAPFSVTATSKTLPADLNAGESVIVTVTFAPNTVGGSGPIDLAVTRTPAKGDDKMRCSGNARAPVEKLTLIPTSLPFGKHPVGSSNSLSLKLRNDGEVPLSLSFAASPTGIPFAWSSYNSTLAIGASQVIPVAFIPISEGPASATLTVIDTTSGATHSIPLSGSGCIANAEIIMPPAPFPAFGQVQRGFRMVRFITVKNTGDGPLTFTARIDGADKVLYGVVQAPPAESIVNVVNTRSYSVDPVSPCGPGPAGSGETTVAVVFFANDVPRLTNAQLIIDGHNATNTMSSSFTFSLSAEIIAPIAVDVALVLDRSGSMSETIGTRMKADAAVAGGRLFAELIRPDLDDRLTVVKYDDIVDVLQPTVHVNSANQPGIVAKINTTELAPRGTTCIAGGVMIALDQLAVPRAVPPAALTKAMVVLTDGMDNTAYHNPTDGMWYSILGGNSWNQAGGMIATKPLSTPSDVKIYGIGLGKEEDIDKGALNKLSTFTGAYSGVVGDLVGPAYFSLEKYFTQIHMDVIGVSTISDPVFTIAPGQQQSIEFDVLEGDVGAMVVVFDYDGMRLPFSIVSPKGEVIDGVTVPPDFQLRVGSTTTARFVDFLMPPGQPQRCAGRWTVVVEHHGEVCSGDVRSRKDMRTGFLPYNCHKYGKPVDFGIAIGVGSNFRMQPYVTPTPVCVGDPILLTAVVTEAGLPVRGCTVTVKAVAPSGAIWNLTLLDDGAHEDADRDDGEYARQFTQTAEAGGYEFTFRAAGLSRDGKPVVREAVRAKYVEGRITVDPNGGRPGEPDLCCERLLKLLEKALGGKRTAELPLTAGKPALARPVTKQRKTKKVT